MDSRLHQGRRGEELPSIAPVAALEGPLATVDQTIIEGEKRISRLALLMAAMGERGFCTNRIEALMVDHQALLKRWEERRLSRATSRDPEQR
jgi:hypothetical protein